METIVMNHNDVAAALASGEIVRDTAAPECATLNDADTVESDRAPLAHFTATVKDMRAALTQVGKVVETRSSIQILECVMFTVADTWRGDSWITVQGTDLDVYVTVNIPGEVHGQGSTAVNLKALKATLKGRKPSETVTLQRHASDEHVTVSVAGTVHKIQSCGPDEWPVPAPIENGEIAAVDAGELHSLFGDVQGAMSNEVTRYYLNGAMLESDENGALRAVSTDGHRMHVRTTDTAWPAMGVRSENADTGEVSRESQVIVPSLAVARLVELTKGGAGDVVIESDGAGALFVGNAWELRCKLVDGTYPDWQRVVPDTASRQHVATVETGAVADVCKSIGAGRAEFNWSDGAIRVRQNGDEVTSEYPLARINGECALERIGINAAYVADVLARFDSDGDVNFCMADESAPILVTSGLRPEFRAVVMPIA